MKRFWSGQEKPVGTAKRCFRVKVVGSNPTGPTKTTKVPSELKAISLTLYFNFTFNLQHMAEQSSVKAMICH
jgi:hypothetical protein